MRWRLLTVGGSDEPIVKSIKDANPRADRIVFFCSSGASSSATQVEGEGLVCGPHNEDPTRPNIPAQCSLAKDKYSIAIINNFDNIDECYEVISEKINEIREEDSHADITCDYTGGTKSMTAALVLSAVHDRHAKLALMTGKRNDLVRVESGTEKLFAETTSSINFNTLQREINLLINTFQYDSAIELIMDYRENKNNPEPDMRSMDYLYICQGFDAWDKFDHVNAHYYLKDYEDEEDFDDYVTFLKSVYESEKDAWKSEAGYMLAEDLLLNAQRCAKRARYDDAIGRHYRAVELVAQTFLYTIYSIDTGSVDSSILNYNNPDEGSRNKQIGLKQAWKLASTKSPGIWRDFYNNRYQNLERSCLVRNESLFAHGTVGIKKEEYEADVNGGMAKFVSEALELLKKKGNYKPTIELKQFPNKLPDDF